MTASRIQQQLIVDFVETALGNRITGLSAALPANHFLFQKNVRQIRKVKDALAYGWDELGNRVHLSTDLRVKQDLPGDL